MSEIFYFKCDDIRVLIFIFTLVRNLVVCKVWSYETSMCWTNSRRLLTKLKVENVYVLHASNEKKKKRPINWRDVTNVKTTISIPRCTRSTSNYNACDSRKWIVHDRCTSLHPPCNCAHPPCDSASAINAAWIRLK